MSNRRAMKLGNHGGVSRLLLFLLYLSFTSFGRDTITLTNFIKDPETIISDGGSFQLGFFSPVNSTSRYVGIWFMKFSPQTVIWVADRDKPLKTTSGVFTISQDGNLVLFDEQNPNTILWSTNVSNLKVNATIARITDTGNLVLEDSGSGITLWESFKHPTDIFFEPMKLITSTRTKDKVQLTSWKTSSDPSTGNFSLSLDVLGIPEAVIWNGNSPHWRSGPWNGQSFLGIPDMTSVYIDGFNLVFENQTYYLSMANPDVGRPQVYYLLKSQGNLEQKFWDTKEKDWQLGWSALQTQCDFYGTCGAFGMCIAQSSPICSCLKGFEPRVVKEWNQGNWKDGCVRKTPLQCEKSNNISTEQSKEDGFFKMERVKLPPFAEWSYFYDSADACRTKCFSNCSCNAYSYENGIGCMLWTGNLTDIQTFEVGGADLFIRLTYTELDVQEKNNKGIVIASVISGIVIFIIVLYVLWRWMTGKHEEKRKQIVKKRDFVKLTRNDAINNQDNLNQVKLQEVQFYDIEKLEIATNDFHLSAKLGQGGFGPVYRGKLSDGQEIAVKRLSRASNQGYEEFINEVTVISKLQHRNLVRLLGCCVEEDEKMLINEYMPNLSLDALIFDSTKQKLLDWRKRFNIIDGIARGLLYLHRDSRLKIIHRDLKASNILLDEDWNPKISDFGMARIFVGNNAEANTSRVVGTYGYMSPEYAMQGQFSEKSDVFSFGVLLLEIISGRRNTSFYYRDSGLSLLGYAWKLWIEDNAISLIDPTIYESGYQLEILRCIQVGLLCVQEYVDDRPNVFTVISMLNSQNADLPQPNHPGFIGRQLDIASDSLRQSSQKYSVNIDTNTTILGR